MARPPQRRSRDPGRGPNARRSRKQAEAAARAGQTDGPQRRDVDAENERIPLAERWAVAEHQARTFLWPPHTRRVSKAMAVAVLLLNVAPLPGLGTALYGKWERGVAQFAFTFLFFVGWVWAVIDGVHVVQVAFASHDPGSRGRPRVAHRG